MQCIITGCVLVDEQQHRWCYGDLFVEGDALSMLLLENSTPPGVLIHNAAEIKGVYWKHLPIPDDSKCTAYIIAVQEYFDKRGIVVIKASDVQFNKAARDRILVRK